MKKIALFFSLCLLISFCSYSQTKQESIKELSLLMHKDSILYGTLNSAVSEILKIEMRKDSATAKYAERILNSKLTIIKELTTKIVMEENSLYDKNFTEKEIEDFITFYKSPSGKKLLDLSPAISSELRMIIQQKYQPEFMKLVIHNNGTNIK